MKIPKINYNVSPFKEDLAFPELEGNAVLKKVGRNSDYFIYNDVQYKITDISLNKLKVDSDRAKDFLKLKTDVDILVTNEKELSKLFNSFLSNRQAYNKELFLKSFEKFITYSKYENLSMNDIDTYLLLEFFLKKEEYEMSYTYSKQYDIRASNLRTNFEKHIFKTEEIKNIGFLKNKKYSKNDLKIALKTIVTDEKKQQLVLIAAMDFKQTSYNPYFNFQKRLNDFEIPPIYQYPFNYLDSQPKYSYPLLANSVVLPMTHRPPNEKNSYQQVELSTAACHTAYYYRKARWTYIINKEKIQFDLFLKLLENSKINLDLALLSKISALVKSNKNAVANLSKIKNKIGDAYDEVRNIIIKIHNLLRLYDNDKVELIKKANLIIGDDSIKNFIQNNVETIRDKDIFGNDIPFYYIEENDKVVFKYDLELKDGYKVTNFIVAKEKRDNNGNKKAIDIQSIKLYGIDHILNNDTDYPIKKGFYRIETPYLIYYLPYKNNFLAKGVQCYDGHVYHNWLKRTRVLYIPDFWIERTKREANSKSYKKHLIDKDNFVIPDGRLLSGLPALVYSYMLTPMNNNDKLIYFENFEN